MAKVFRPYTMPKFPKYTPPSMFLECENHKIFDGVGASRDAWWWRLKSRNGQIIATSENYNSKGNCNRAAKKVAAKLRINVKLLPPR